LRYALPVALANRRMPRTIALFDPTWEVPKWGQAVWKRA
jgi:hypothetical protein